MSVAPLVPLLLAAPDVMAIVGGPPVRIYRSRVPQDTDVPYLVWTRISSVPAASLDAPVIDNVRIQVDAFAVDAVSCEALASAAQAAIEADGENVLIGLNIDGMDPTTNLYRISKDYSFWVSRSS